MTHTRYRIRSKVICLPDCPGLGCKHNKTNGCGCEEGCCASPNKECGKPRMVKVLFKRFVPEKGCDVVCKPAEVPAECPAEGGCCGGKGKH